MLTCIAIDFGYPLFRLVLKLTLSWTAYFSINRQKTVLKIPTNFVHLILGDPEAASRYDAKFWGETEFTPRAVYSWSKLSPENIARPKTSHRPDYQFLGLRGCAHLLNLCELLLSSLNHWNAYERLLTYYRGVWQSQLHNETTLKLLKCWVGDYIINESSVLSFDKSKRHKTPPP